MFARSRNSIRMMRRCNATVSATPRTLSTASEVLSQDAIDASVNKLSQGTLFPWEKVCYFDLLMNGPTYVRFLPSDRF